MSTNILVCYEDDFGAWNAENNPDHLPVIQWQTVGLNPPHGNVGGWVLWLWEPGPSPYILGIGHATAEQAIAAATQRIADLEQ